METGEIMTEIRLLRDDVRQLRAGIQDIREDVERTRGFVGGVLWCASGVAAMGGFMWGLVSGDVG